MSHRSPDSDRVKAALGEVGAVGTAQVVERELRAPALRHPVVLCCDGREASSKLREAACNVSGIPACKE